MNSEILNEPNLDETKPIQIKLDLNNVPIPVNLNDLCKEIHKVFANDTVNVEYVIKLLENYKSNVKDWRQYAKYDPHKYNI